MYDVICACLSDIYEVIFFNLLNYVILKLKDESEPVKKKWQSNLTFLVLTVKFSLFFFFPLTVLTRIAKSVFFFMLP